MQNAIISVAKRVQSVTSDGQTETFAKREGLFYFQRGLVRLMSVYERILSLSDINWSPSYKGTNVKELIGLVEQVNPTLVMLAGDLVDNDKGGVRNQWFQYWQEISKFLNFLEDNKIRCYFVRGNWDEKPEYNKLVQQNYSFIEEISEKIAEANNVRTLGVSHAFTSTLTSIKKLRGLCTTDVDMVLAHADGTRGRRIWLFELPAKLIITGHFDQKLCLIRDKVFLSFSNFPGQYAVIEYQNDEIDVAYIVGERMYKVKVIKGTSEWMTEQPQNWSRYGLQMEALLTFKETEGKLDAIAKREAINKLLQQGIYKDHIRDYIPGARAILK
jgi:predicted phosphodiesterase